MITDIIIIVLAAYLLGSISFSVIISKLIGCDIRKKGSGNAGATNMARIYGAAAGFATFGFDMLKAVLSVYIGHKLMGDAGLAIAGLSCIVGHCFPVFHKFKGGKGVSVGAALAFAMDWRVGLFVVAAFLLTALPTKKVSIGSCAAAVSIVIASLIFNVSTPLLVMSVLGMCLVVFQHRANLVRVMNHTEPDFKFAKKEK